MSFLKVSQRSALTIAAAVLLATAALPAAAADPKVVALQVRLQNLGTEEVAFQSIEDRVQLALGNRYRVSLVGADRAGDSSGDVAVQSRFAEAAGRGAIDLGNSGGNFVVVEPLAVGSSELSYEVTQSYDMPAAWRTGRILIDVVAGTGGTGSVTDRARWQHSQDLATLLYQTILQESPSQERERNFEADVRRIYDEGFPGLRGVALALGGEARERDTFGHQRSSQVVGELYRDLLGRTGSNDELFRSDAGFRENVDRMGRGQKIVDVIETIVGSEEFRRNHNLDGLGLMSAAR